MSNIEGSTSFFAIDSSAPFNQQSFEQFVQALTFGGKLKGVFYQEGTVNFASMVDSADTNEQITVVGVSVGDHCEFVYAEDLQEITMNVYVAQDDVVEVNLINEAGATIDLNSNPYKLWVYDLT